MIYKGGFSAGGNYAPALENNPRRIANAIGSLYLLPGVPVLYAGTEIGAQNNMAYARQVQREQYLYMQSQGIEVDEASCFDPRPLQRGPQDAEDFERAKRDHYEPLVTWRRLNQLRKKEPSLRGKAIAPVTTGHDDVIAALRTSDEGRPILGLVNLSTDPRELRIPKDAVAALSGTWTDLLTNKAVRPDEDGDTLVLRVPPESRYFLSS